MITNEEEIRRQAARATARKQRTERVLRSRGKSCLDISDALKGLPPIAGLGHRLFAGKPLTATQYYKVVNAPLHDEVLA